jgi:3-carboxy-cis,cis-muconate cycloisomerase
VNERPSSSTSELFGGTYARGRVTGEVSDTAWVQAMLDVEHALGGPALAAEDIDIAELGRLAAEHASAAVPLARRFPATHTGATSQDIIDTATARGGRCFRPRRQHRGPPRAWRARIASRR